MIKNIQLFPFGIYGRIQNLTESYTGAVSITPTSFSTGKPQLSTLVFFCSFNIPNTFLPCRLSIISPRAEHSAVPLLLATQGVVI